ncbi:hypothetical protein MP228_012076 [Amoeboaphelidium protococcarum]|nr:hypothetical protein MP228_012076 [Amoeboaphelidium protococcarum]
MPAKTEKTKGQQQYTPVKELEQITRQLRDSFASGVTRPYEYRMEQLHGIRRLVTDEESMQILLDAMVADGKCRGEALLGDLYTSEKDVNKCLANLHHWMSPQAVSMDLASNLSGDSGYVQYDPLGMVLIIGTWNYPVNSAISPLIGAIAAGNTAVLKLSEVSSNTSQALASLFNKYLDSQCYRVVTGAVEEVTALLRGSVNAGTERQWKWDHIFLTGNSQVGKVIARAAAETLTPTTLELGGKSPCIIDLNIGEATVQGGLFSSFSMKMDTVTTRLVASKFFNVGQTCIAPDYVLVPQQHLDLVIDHVKAQIVKLYGSLDAEEIKKNLNSFGRIVSRRHYDRLDSMLKKTRGRIVVNEDGRDANELYIPPTVVVLEPSAGDLNSICEDALMQEEIFGPIMIIIAVPSAEQQDGQQQQFLQQCIQFINNREKPLAAYLFSNNYKSIEQFQSEVLSGGQLINDCLMHFTCETLPFGGVGNSGYGQYHGKFSFDCFSHRKAVMKRNVIAEVGNQLRYPPYTTQKSNLIHAALVPAAPKMKQQSSSWFW